MTYFNWLDHFYPAYQVSSGRLGTKFFSGAIWWGRKHAIGEVSLRPGHGREFGFQAYQWKPRNCVGK